MKGNQGLDALATLCNNASKSNEENNTNSSERENHHSQRSAPITSSATDFNNAINYTANTSQQLHGAQSLRGLPSNLEAILKSLGPNPSQQQAAAIMANAGLPAGNNDPTSALQHLVYMNSIQNPSPLAQFMAQANPASQHNFSLDQSAVNALFLAAQNRQGGNFQVLPNNGTSQHDASNAIKSTQFSGARQPTHNAHQAIVMRSGEDGMIRSLAEEGRSASSTSKEHTSEDKKMQKRAANRRSAQLSRKRKKQFIEELKEENDELRRKEQILRSIPDLIVVFDSSGKLGFVSHSVSNFLEFTPDELVGSSFWERLCEESVRLLKAAFMDALAARDTEHETTPLGAGVWELRLQDKNGNFVLVTLNGVVHFSGEAPECVCSIRPMQSGDSLNETNNASSNATGTEGAADADSNKRKASDLMYGTIKPEQSVVKKKSVGSNRSVRPKVAAALGPNGRPAPISDVDSGTSVVSSE